MVATIQEQLKAYIVASPTIMALAVGGVWTRPLKRGGDPLVTYTGEADPTPQAFDEETQWVKPCIVISPRVDRGTYYGTRRATGNYMLFAPVIAYYAPPTDQQGETLQQMSLYTGRLLNGKRIQFAPGEFGKVVVPHEVIGSVEIPEMPNSGVVMVERFEIPAVFQRD